MTCLLFTIEGSPLPWQRARGNGRARYTSPEQRAYQRRVKLAAVAAWQRAKSRVTWRTDVRYEVQVVACWPDARKRDVDNALKQACDSIKAVLYADDCQVDHVTAARARPNKTHPRLVVLVRAMSQAESEAAAQALEQMMSEEAA